MAKVEPNAVVRIYYQGQRPRTGKLFMLQGASFGESDGNSFVRVTGAPILDILRTKFPQYDLFKAFFYHESMEGFVELEEKSLIDASFPLGRVNVVLEPNVHEPYSPVDTIMLRAIQSHYCPDHEGDIEDSALEASQPRLRRDPEWRNENDREGWFGIGIIRNKSAPNHGTLWRSAYQLGASFAFSIGDGYHKSVEGNADVPKMWAKAPFIQYPNWENFAESSPYACPWIAIGDGGTPLPDFIHPARAIYFLGCEDNGLPDSIADHCHFHVSVPSLRPHLCNVSVTGSVVMYDRLQKLQLQVPNAKISPELMEALELYRTFVAPPSAN